MNTYEPGSDDTVEIVHQVYKIKADMKSYKLLETAAISYSTFSETGYELGVCHGWFHSHGLIGAVRIASRAWITKCKILAHSGIRTRDLSLTERARYHWATKTDANRVDKSSPGFYLCYF